MILYYPTKFHFDTMKSFRVVGREHFPSPPGPGNQNGPGPDRVKLSLEFWIYNLQHVMSHYMNFIGLLACVYL